VVQGRALPKTVAIAGAVLILLLALFLVPAKFQLSGKGKLEPVSKRDVFATLKGTVRKIFVKHGQMVKAGDPLVLIKNPDLTAQVEDVQGKLNSAYTEFHAAERQLQNAGRNHLTTEEQERIRGQATGYETQAESLERQLKILREKEKQLEVVSPINGQIVTWQIEEKLFQRPVEEGQLLMTVADPDGPWEIDVRMPEDRMGFVARRANEKHDEVQQKKLAGEATQPSDEQLDASYILATNPGSRYYGKVFEIGQSAEVMGDDGNVVLLKVSIDKSEHDAVDLKQGADVTAKIDCGTASIGYCWFHDLISFIQSRLFRL
jgi:multidrug efflux pump subunit AcrA (membrane-fusion protein)